MRRLSFVLATATLCALTSLGCKQDIGERCEQPSDCASGYCGGSSVPIGMTSAEGRTCSAGPTTAPPPDSAAPEEDAGGTDASANDATVAPEAGSDATAAPEAGSDLKEAGGDAASNGPPEGGTEAGGDAAAD